jgi:predicted ATPase
LCEKHGDNDNLFVALWNVWLTTAIRDVAAARPLSKKLLLLTERTEDAALRLEAHHSAWYTCFAAGEPAAARGHCDEGRRLYDFERHCSLASSYGGHDPGVCARQWGALVEWLLGYADTALVSAREGTQLAERLRHPLTLEHALFNQSVLHLFRQEPDMAFAKANEGAAWAADQRLALLWDPDILRGSALLGQGAVEEAVASTRAGLAARDVFGWPLGRQFLMTLAAEVFEAAGDPDAALAALANAESTVAANGEHWWEAEIHRRRGMLQVARDAVGEGESCFQRSIAVARRQQAKSLELRAATSLARLWGEQGRRREARELLAPVYGWFTEGFDTPDLKEARRLLGELV